MHLNITSYIIGIFAVETRFKLLYRNFPTVHIQQKEVNVEMLEVKRVKKVVPVHCICAHKTENDPT